jgi:ABC-type molybdate transport system substrate-binding protein
MRIAAIALAILSMTGPAMAETIQLYAAGSLRLALTDVAKAYEATSGNKVEAKWGASGLLKNEIVAGAKTDVFASAIWSIRRRCTTPAKAARWCCSRATGSARW